MVAGRIELPSAGHEGGHERNPRGVPYELAGSSAAQRERPAKRRSMRVLSVMPKTNLLYGTDFGAAR
jgi:hypothetical protein